MPSEPVNSNHEGPYVLTATGRADASTLGHILPHEHLYVDWPSAIGAEPVPMVSEEVVAAICARLERAADVGVGTFVDVGASLGPGPELLAAVAARTRVRLVAAIGFVSADLGPLPSWAYPPGDPEAIAKRLIDEARNGITGSGLRPGVLKVGSSRRAISEVEEAFIRGAVLTQQETGLAITTHTTETSLAMEQIDLLEDAGADLGRVAIGHIGWGTGPGDRELHRRLAARGVFLGLDMVGLPAASVDDFARIAGDLIEDGHADRILLSHDNCAYSRGLVEVYGEEWLTGDFTVVHAQLIPALSELGVSAETLDAILRDNPRRLLAIGAA